MQIYPKEVIRGVYRVEVVNCSNIYLEIAAKLEIR